MGKRSTMMLLESAYARYVGERAPSFVEQFLWAFLTHRQGSRDAFVSLERLGNFNDFFDAQPGGRRENEHSHSAPRRPVESLTRTCTRAQDGKRQCVAQFDVAEVQPMLLHHDGSRTQFVVSGLAAHGRKLCGTQPAGDPLLQVDQILR